MEEYEHQVQRALAQIDKKAIEIVKTLRDSVLYVRDIIQRYGIVHDRWKPGLSLRELSSPQSPLEDECEKFDEAERRINETVNKLSPPMALLTAIAANLEMLYFDPNVTFDNIDQTLTPAC